MTLKQARRRVRYWQETLSELGLHGWDVDVSIEDEPETNAFTTAAEASVTTSIHYDSAWMELSSTLMTKPQVVIDKVIVHELLHIAFRDYNSVVTSVHSQLAPALAEAWDEQLNHESEGIIERLARQIVTLHGE